MPNEPSKVVPVPVPVPVPSPVVPVTHVPATATTPTPAPAVKEPVLNWEAASTYFTSVKNKVMEYKGQPGHNPFIWWTKHGKEIEDQYKGGNRSAHLHAQMSQLKFSVPKV